MEEKKDKERRKESVSDIFPYLKTFKNNLPSWVQMYLDEGGAAKNESEYMVIFKREYEEMYRDSKEGEMQQLREFLKDQEKRLLEVRIKVFITLVIMVVYLLILFVS